MPKTTDHLERASGTSRLDPSQVFGVVADLTLLPAWFFDKDPHPRVEHPTRSVRPVGKGDLHARCGVQIDVESTDGYGTIRGRRLKINEASVDRFICTDVDEGHSIRFAHDTLLNKDGAGHVATRVTITGQGHGSQVSVVHETRVVGRGPHAALARAIRRRSTVSQRIAVRRLIALAEELESEAT